MRTGWAILAGLVGGLSFLVVIWDGILGGLFGIRFLQTLGELVVPRAARQAAYTTGALTHMAFSVAFALAYAWVLDMTGVSSLSAGASLGVAIGSVHGAASIPLVAGVRGWARGHDGSGIIRFGFPGRSTMIMWLIAHLVFGLTVGSIYMVHPS